MFVVHTSSSLSLPILVPSLVAHHFRLLQWLHGFLDLLLPIVVLVLETAAKKSSSYERLWKVGAKLVYGID